MIVILPMAGRGSRFSEKGYTTPKPLINVAGKPMFYWALQSLKGLPVGRLVVVALQEHEELYKLTHLFRQYCNLPVTPDFVLLSDITEGQLCTVMAAENYFDNDHPLLIAASDTLVISSLAADIESKPDNCVGLISVADLPGDRWSFARTNQSGRVLEVAEKVRISNHASTGIYYFSRCGVFKHFARQILDNKEKTKGEYYVIPVFQKMIDAGMWVGISRAHEMWDMGTPDAKAAFEQHLKNS